MGNFIPCFKSNDTLYIDKLTKAYEQQVIISLILNEQLRELIIDMNNKLKIYS